jgi:hypothetical protein
MRNKSIRKVKKQYKKKAIKAKFGASMKPAPVIVKRLDTGEILDVCDQSKITKEKPHWVRRRA